MRRIRQMERRGDPPWPRGDFFEGFHPDVDRPGDSRTVRSEEGEGRRGGTYLIVPPEEI